MPVVVAFVSQKGGVGKSTLARALATVTAHAGVAVMLSDLDPQQSTLMHWGRARGSDATPTLRVEAFASVDNALEAGEESELVILDMPGRADATTLAAATHAHLVVQPTGPSLDDLRPAVLLFHELATAGIPRSRLIFALCRTLTKSEETDARAYLEESGFAVLPGSIPERAAYRQAQNRGLSLTEADDTELSRRADALIASLMDKVGEEIEALAEALPVAARRKRGKEDVA